MSGDGGPATWPEETIPILRVTDAAASLAWYRRLGFVEEWVHRFTPTSPAFVSVRRGPEGPGVRLFLSEHTGDAVPGGLVYIRVADVRPVAAEFGIELRDEGGSRLDIGLVDPDGNRLRLGSPTGRTEPGYTFPD
jgi:catechol 2,3-dioxygenase-like lactoylglutathione lyase family enzyme